MDSSEYFVNLIDLTIYANQKSQIHQEIGQLH